MRERRADVPPNLTSLTTRINNLARQEDRPVRRVQRAIANTVVGQLLPPGVVKGGTAMKLRIGEAGSRFTPDLDASRSHLLSLDDYLDALQENLSNGWDGFGGVVVERNGPHPKDVPEDYVMQPFGIKLDYKGRHWLTVDFELGRDEVGSTDRPEMRIADDIVELFHALGLETPAPIPLLAVDHQVAQKLHACTFVDPRTGANERAHDLVDLQLIEQEEAVDYHAVASTARRLFVARRGHPWPPTVVSYENWNTIYREAAEDLGVRETVDEAVQWANDFIAKAVASSVAEVNPDPAV